jgi:hypothetical protein
VHEMELHNLYTSPNIIKVIQAGGGGCDGWGYGKE